MPQVEKNKGFFIEKGGQTYGPLTLAQVHTFHRSGKIEKEDYIFQKGWGESIKFETFLWMVDDLDDTSKSSALGGLMKLTIIVLLFVGVGLSAYFFVDFSHLKDLAGHAVSRNESTDKKQFDLRLKVSASHDVLSRLKTKSTYLVLIDVADPSFKNKIADMRSRYFSGIRDRISSLDTDLRNTLKGTPVESASMNDIMLLGSMLGKFEQYYNQRVPFLQQSINEYDSLLAYAERNPDGAAQMIVQRMRNSGVGSNATSRLENLNQQYQRGMVSQEQVGMAALQSMFSIGAEVAQYATAMELANAGMKVELAKLTEYKKQYYDGYIKYPSACLSLVDRFVEIGGIYYAYEELADRIVLEYLFNNHHAIPAQQGLFFEVEGNQSGEYIALIIDEGDDIDIYAKKVSLHEGLEIIRISSSEKTTFGGGLSEENLDAMLGRHASSFYDWSGLTFDPAALIGSIEAYQEIAEQNKSFAEFQRVIADPNTYMGGN